MALLLVLSLVLSAVPFPGNVETVYATEVEEQVDTESTAESTDAPADPYIINENYDGKANSPLADTVTEKYSWAFAGDTSGATVVSKVDAISGGAADRLLNFDIKNVQMVRVNSSRESFVGATLTRGAWGYGLL